MAITVPYAELYTYPRGRWVTGHFFGVRKLLCLWADMPTLMSQIGTSPDFAWPATHYQFGTSDALAKEILIEPHKAAMDSVTAGDPPAAVTEFASYEYAELTVKYSTSDYTWVNGAEVKERFSPAPEGYTIAPELLQWSAIEQLETNEAPSMMIWGMTYTLEFNNLSTSPPDTTDWIGYINSNTVTTLTLGRTMAPETLLFNGTDLTVRFGYAGGYKWNARHYFHYRKQGWNNHPHVGAQAANGVLSFDPLYLRADNSIVKFFDSTTF